MVAVTLQKKSFHRVQIAILNSERSDCLQGVQCAKALFTRVEANKMVGECPWAHRKRINNMFEI